MADGEAEELSSGEVLRLAKIRDDFPPNSRKPQPQHFSPRDDEKYLTVWDTSRTTATQARAFLPTDGPYNAYTLPVAGIVGIDVASGMARLRVLREKLSAEDRAKPGGDGHCGVDGLKRPPGLENGKEKLKVVRSKVCDLATFDSVQV